MRERNRRMCCGEESKLKHEKEWYTCDRCGKEIEEDMDSWKHLPRHFIKKIKYSETIAVISNEPYGYVCGEAHELPDIKAVSILRGYHKKEKITHLCGKCRKDFERFMRNEM